MNKVCLLLIALGLSGCAAAPSVPPAALPAVTTVAGSSCASAALVFDAPITFDQAPLDLSRANHGQAAFFGFDQGSTSYYDIVTDNREGSGHNNQYVRESVSERVGSTSR